MKWDRAVRLTQIWSRKLQWWEIALMATNTVSYQLSSSSSSRPRWCLSERRPYLTIVSRHSSSICVHVVAAANTRERDHDAIQLQAHCDVTFMTYVVGIIAPSWRACFSHLSCLLSSFLICNVDWLWSALRSYHASFSGSCQCSFLDLAVLLHYTALLYMTVWCWLSK